MAIKLNKITSSNSIVELSSKTNSNFAELETIINTLLQYNQITDAGSSLKGYTKLELFKGQSNTPNTGYTSFETNSSVKIDGNITNLYGKYIGKTIELSNGAGLKITNGVVEQLDSTLINSFKGSIKSDKAFIDTSIGTPLDAYKKTTYTSGGTNYYPTSDPDYIIGWISTAGRSTVILNFKEYDSGTIANNVNKVTLLTTDVVAGHKLTVIVKMDDSLPNDFWIVSDTLYSTTAYGFTTGIKFNKSGQVAEFQFDGTKWIVTNLQGASRD